MSARGVAAWVESTDCVLVDSEGNGVSRGDGYDVDIYRSRSTGRYIVRVTSVSRGRSSWYTATTLTGAQSVGQDGYTPGYGPGRYTYVACPGRLAEVRALPELRVEGGAV